MQEHKLFYTRNLPHYQPEEGTFFITYRLHNSIPKIKIPDLKREYHLLKNQNPGMNDEEKLKANANYFRLFDEALDNNPNEPYWLKDPAVMKTVADSLLFNSEKQYKLWCFSIMPNHVHVLVTLLVNSLPLYAILQKHKRYSAWQCNKLLNRTGSFWHKESYDHLVRNAESFNRIIKYILNNPVKAGLINSWLEWGGNYLNPEL
jgi:putative transposase